MEAIGVGGDCPYFLGYQSFGATISEEWMRGGGGEERRSAVQRGMDGWYGREVPPTLTVGSNAGGRMCGRVVAGGLTAINVLTADESQMATVGMFIEPQLPMTHLQLARRCRRIISTAAGADKANWVQAYSRRSVGGGRRLAK